MQLCRIRHHRWTVFSSLPTKGHNPSGVGIFLYTSHFSVTLQPKKPTKGSRLGTHHSVLLGRGLYLVFARRMRSTGLVKRQLNLNQALLVSSGEGFTCPHPRLQGLWRNATCLSYCTSDEYKSKISWAVAWQSLSCMPRRLPSPQPWFCASVPAFSRFRGFERRWHPRDCPSCQVRRVYLGSRVEKAGTAKICIV